VERGAADGAGHHLPGHSGGLRSRETLNVEDDVDERVPGRQEKELGPGPLHGEERLRRARTKHLRHWGRHLDEPRSAHVNEAREPSTEVLAAGGVERRSVSQHGNDPWLSDLCREVSLEGALAFSAANRGRTLPVAGEGARPGEENGVGATERRHRRWLADQHQPARRQAVEAPEDRIDGAQRPLAVHDAGETVAEFLRPGEVGRGERQCARDEHGFDPRRATPEPDEATRLRQQEERQGPLRGLEEAPGVPPGAGPRVAGDEGVPGGERSQRGDGSQEAPGARVATARPQAGRREQPGGNGEERGAWCDTPRHAGRGTRARPERHCRHAER
jgi:hypothetical protein